MLQLIVDEKSSKEYSLSIYERPNIPTPKMRVEYRQVHYFGVPPSYYFCVKHLTIVGAFLL
jgi:hypothetical protein